MHAIVLGKFSEYDVMIFRRIREVTNCYVPSGGGHIIFAFSAVSRPASGHLVSAHLKEKYLSYLYQIWYGCLLG